MTDAQDYDDCDEGEQCPKCNGDGMVNCYCGGDLCVCTNYGEKACGLCGGEGVTSPERAAKYLKQAREAHAAFQAGWNAAQSKKGDAND